MPRHRRMHPDRAPASKLAPLLEHGGKRGFVVADMSDADEFAPIESVELPAGPVYVTVDPDRGDHMANCSPDEALPAIIAAGRTPLTLGEGIHWLLQQPEVLERNHCFMVEGTKLNEAKLTDNIEHSVMMVTALAPVIGYDKAAAIAYYAIDHDLTLKQAALANGVSGELFDKVVDPLALTRPGSADVPSGPGKT